MAKKMSKVRLGTRRSTLARWQTDYVMDLLATAHPGLSLEVEVIVTKGDRVDDSPLPLIGGKGLFTAELETALQSGQIDIAVHSLKDLPTTAPANLTLGAIPSRANAADVLISRDGFALDMLPTNAKVGTSSRRRAAQLLHYRPDLQIIDIRGNVDTRMAKVLDPTGPYDATVLAYAGLERLDRLDLISQVLPFEIMLPAPGQGALGVQCRNEEASRLLLAEIDDQLASVEVTAERAFLARLEGGCSTPVAAYAHMVDGVLKLRGRVLSVDGQQMIDLALEGKPSDAKEIGCKLAEDALSQGAGALLELIFASSSYVYWRK